MAEKRPFVLLDDARECGAAPEDGPEGPAAAPPQQLVIRIAATAATASTVVKSVATKTS